MTPRRIFSAVFVGALALAAWPAVAPAPKSDFDIEAFGRLPALEGGRIKPIDTFARNTLLIVRSKQTVRVDGRSLSATRWLLDAAFKPETADTYPSFVVDDPEVLGLLGLAQGKGRYFAYWQLEPRRDEINKQAQSADAVPSGARSRFQTAVLALETRMSLYERVKNTFMPSGRGDPSAELASFQALMRAAMEALRSGQASKGAAEMMAALDARMRAYQFLAEAAAFKSVPPLKGEPDEAWASFGESMLRPGAGHMTHPSVPLFARMAASYRAGDAAGFNAAVAEQAAWARENAAEATRHARVEALFNRAQPFISGMTLYVVALLLVFASWATRREDVSSAAHAVFWAAFVIHTLGLLARTVLQGRPPVTNLYSSAVFVGWGAVLLGLFGERIHRRGFAAAGASAVGFGTLLIAHHLGASGDTMDVMRAVLDSNFWLTTHVITITIGYSGTYLAGLLAAAWIARRHFVRKPDPADDKAIVSLTYGVIAFGLFFSFIGTVLGGIWADQSWGRFWGWDPKENGALLIVLWNALILHMRWAGFVRERGIMMMAVFGNIITSVSWFGVNMLGIGLHSYGFMDSAFWWLLLFSVSQLLLIMLAALPPRFWSHARQLDA
ncbi:MAG: cytochrome c biogenesis protein CcsA [Elusimicrobiota bacterium]|nr:cytochrome c biogenesis protein CcsA [Elusimicrobiota bacterium]